MLKNRLIKDTTKLGLSTLISKFIVIIRGFVIPRIVSPEVYGIFRTLNLVLDYTGLGHLGFTHAIDKQIPFYRGQNDQESLKIAKNSAFTFIFLISIFFAIVLCGYSFTYSNNPIYHKGILVVAITIPFVLFFLYSSVLLRTENRFGILSIISVTYTLIALVLAAILGKYYGAIGLILSVFLSYFLIDGFLWFKGDLKLLFMIDLSQLKLLFRVGLPLLIIQLLYQILLTVDSLIIIKNLPVVQFGYYSIAITISRSVQDIPLVINGIIFPRSSEKFGETGNPKDLENLFISPLILISLLMPFIIGTLIFLSEIFIDYVIPKYRPAFLPTEILLMGGFFISCAMISYQLFISIGKLFHVVKIYIVIIVIEFVLCYLAMKLGWGLKGIAFGVLISCAVFSVIMTFSSMGYFKDTWGQRINLILKMFLPFGYTLIFVFLAQFLFHTGLGFIKDMLVLLERWLLLTLISIPLFIHANKNTEYFQF